MTRLEGKELLEYADLVDAEINSSTLKGSYKYNNVLAFIINFNWKFYETPANLYGMRASPSATLPITMFQSLLNFYDLLLLFSGLLKYLATSMAIRIVK